VDGLNGRSHSVSGVLPGGFLFVESLARPVQHVVDLWVLDVGPVLAYGLVVPLVRGVANLEGAIAGGLLLRDVFL
jgi:hypothetical protein